jgi:hypothetical protein
MTDAPRLSCSRSHFLRCSMPKTPRSPSRSNPLMYKGPSTDPRSDMRRRRRAACRAQLAAPGRLGAAPDGIGYAHDDGLLEYSECVLAGKDHDHIVASVVLNRAAIDASAGPARLHSGRPRPRIVSRRAVSRVDRRSATSSAWAAWLAP